MKPSRSKAGIASTPATRGILGTNCDLEVRDERLNASGHRNLLQVQLSSFAKIRESLLDRFDSVRVINQPIVVVAALIVLIPKWRIVKAGV